MSAELMELPPRVVIAAPRSGSGKTTAATGIIAALAARGLDVSAHKVGPDYIDPSYHSMACGRPGRNLDPFMVGEERVPGLFAHGALGASISIVEGVMGLFDGVALQGDFASTAHVARLLDAPVVFVMDASGVSNSVGALLHGFRTWDPRIQLAGVIFTMVASDRHEELLRDAMHVTGLPILGMLRRDPELVIPSRHLGLIPVVERTAAVAAWLDRLKAITESQIDLDAVIRIASAAPFRTVEPWTPPIHSSGKRPVIAVAGGVAFSFGYQEQLEALTAAGADVVGFDPTTDEHLPLETAGLIAGGGFPEIYADSLSSNASLHAEVRELIVRGGPVAAECGGLLWLATTLDGHPMGGHVAADAVMTPRLVLGYREAVAVADNPVVPVGTAVRGHEFHRTITTPVSGARAAWVVGGVEHGWSEDNLVASYLHLHWAGIPEAAPRFVTAASRICP